jgi:hypothetical protein
MRLGAMLGNPFARTALRGFLAAAVVVGVTAAGQPPAHTADVDPGTMPLPALDDNDPAKAVVARVDFASRTSASLDQAFVSVQRAHTHLGDPPILRLRLNDPDGNLIEQMNAWSPLWVFTRGARERLEIQSSGSGSFIVPFSPALSSLTIRDIGLARDIVTVDVEPAIHDFCVANPNDPDCLEADLAVDSITPTAPLFAVMGKAVTVSVANVVANKGPDGPVDAEVTTSLVAAANLTVTPSTSETTTEAAVASGTTRTITKTYSVTCNAAGAHTVDFTTAIAPKRATVVDPTAGNNTLTKRVTLDCAVPVTINIQPGSLTNPVNRNGSTLPVAILTTRAGEYGNPLAFDATRIEPLSLRFGSNTALLADAGVPEIHGAIHAEDSRELDERTRDGDLDAVTHYRPRASAIAATDTEACVFGRFTSPTGQLSFFGCDHVQVTP